MFKSIIALSPRKHAKSQQVVTSLALTGDRGRAALDLRTDAFSRGEEGRLRGTPDTFHSAATVQMDRFCLNGPFSFKLAV